MLIEVVVPVFALAARMPRRGLPKVVEGLVPAVVLLPVWAFLTTRWSYFAPTDIPGTLTTFAIILVLLLAAVAIVHRVSIWSALFCASAGYTIQNTMTSVSTLVGNLADLQGASEAYAEHVLIWEQIILVLVYALCYLLFVRRIWRTRLELVEDRHMVFAFVACLFVVIGFDVLIKGAHSEGLSLALCMAIRGVHIAFCVFLLYFDYRSLAGSRREAEAAVNRHIISERERQYEESRLTIDAVNRRMHDICHSVATTAVEMGATGDPRVDDLIAQVIEEVRHYDTVISTGNEPLDTVLTEKGLVCERGGLRLLPSADGRALAQLEPAETYALVGGLVDAAIETLRHVGDNAGGDVALSVRMRGSMAVVCLEHLMGEDASPIAPSRTVSIIVERYGGTVVDGVRDGIRTLTVTMPLDS